MLNKIKMRHLVPRWDLGGKMTDKLDRITNILAQDDEHMGLLGQDDDIYTA